MNIPTDNPHDRNNSNRHDIQEPMVFLNGQFIPKSQAKISAMDRGFLFGDSVYDVVPVYNGKFFHLDDHIHRLMRSIELSYIEPPYHYDQWVDLAQQMLKLYLTETQQDLKIYIQVSRGYQEERDHRILESIKPTVFMTGGPISTPSRERLMKGFAAITTEDIRWQNCHIKSTSLLANIMALHEATQKNADEAILIRDGKATEGSSSNLFLVKDGVIITPPLSNLILPGITRKIIIDLAKDLNLSVIEQSIDKASLYTADELWITSSTRAIYPIVKLDDNTINSGQPGPVWATMLDHYVQALSC